MGINSAVEIICEVHHGGIDREELARYGVPLDQVIDFSSNVLPCGPSPRVRVAVQAAVLDQYPDRDCRALRRSIADRYSVDVERLLVGNGCSELIHSVASTLTKPNDEVLIIGPTFSEYERATHIAGGHVHHCNAHSQNGFAAPIDEIETLLSDRDLKVVWLCNPNNPTGQSVLKERLLCWANDYPETTFVVDESYIEFAEHTESLLGSDVENLVVLRSMTKTYSIAGLRLGFAWLSNSLYRAVCGRRIPWSVNCVAHAAGIAAIQDEHYYATAMTCLRQSKQAFFSDLASLGFDPIPTDTGFFLLAVEEATRVRKELFAEGLIVRDCRSFGLPNYLRIAVLDSSNNQRLASALTRITNCNPRSLAGRDDSFASRPSRPPDRLEVGDEGFRQQLHQLFRLRRDVRRFRATEIPAGAIQRLIEAACLAPSVGLSQPWRFVSVVSPGCRSAVITEFETQNAIASSNYDDRVAKQYRELKLAGLREAPEHLAVFVDDATAAGRGLGRSTMPETLEYSVVAAIQNLWLAARAEGIGVGWVSILRPELVSAVLKVPPSWRLIAYLCIGYPEVTLADIPELARERWERRCNWSDMWCQR